jgi:hypothetical protein
MVMKIGDLDPDAWGQLVKNKYIIQMHGARGFDVEKAALQVADAALEILGAGRYVARVVRVMPVAVGGGSKIPEYVVKLNSGAVVKIDGAAGHPDVHRGDRVLVQLVDDGPVHIVRVLE